MAYTITETGRVEHDEYWLVTYAHNVDGSIENIPVREWKTNPEEANREALSDLYHAALSRTAVLRREDPVDMLALLDALTDCALLAHRFLHADYSDAEV